MSSSFVPKFPLIPQRKLWLPTINSPNGLNEFDINIIRNAGNNGYKIQTITAKIQDNGKYNMVTLNLDIGPNTPDANIASMKSKISRAIDIVLRTGVDGTDDGNKRDLTGVYRDENEAAAASGNQVLDNSPPQRRNADPRDTKVSSSNQPGGGGKLSRKRKRNMTKSKRRKVGTTRRRR